MANTIIFEMTENQAKSFESLFEGFNQTMKRVRENENTRDEQITKLRTESQLLLGQIKEEIEQIKKLRANGRKPLREL